MVFGRPELEGSVVEHGTTRPGRWLRRYRTRIAFVVAAIEAALLLFDLVDWPAALLLAAAVVVGYFWLVRRLRSALARDLGWIAAVSQALVALVPVFLIVVGAVALIALGLLGVLALILLLRDRR